jgi:hypothetical protein
LSAAASPARTQPLLHGKAFQVLEIWRVKCRRHLVARSDDVVQMLRQNHADRVNGLMAPEPLPLQSIECLGHDFFAKRELVLHDHVDGGVKTFVREPYPGAAVIRTDEISWLAQHSRLFRNELRAAFPPQLNSKRDVASALVAVVRWHSRCPNRQMPDVFWFPSE